MTDSHSTSPFIHSLFAEDFDAPDGGVELLDGMPAEAEPVREVPPDPQAEAVETARSEAYADGFRTGLAQSAQDRADVAGRMLGLIAERMEDAGAAARAHGEAAAFEVSRLLLGTIGILFPLLAARHGGAEVADLVRVLTPTLTSQPRVTIRVGAEMVADVEAELARLDPEALENIRLLPTDGMAPGDARITWNDGSAVRDGAALWSRVAAVMSAHGLMAAPDAIAAPPTADA
jgi:hypothetical protein